MVNTQEVRSSKKKMRRGVKMMSIREESRQKWKMREGDLNRVSR